MSRVSELNDEFELGAIKANASERRLLRRWRDAFDAEYGVVCLSKKRTNVLMWAHYAEQGKGFCYEFEVDGKHFSPVEYIPDRIPMSSLNLSGSLNDVDQPAMRRVLHLKHQGWAYEEEVRSYVGLAEADEAGRYFVPFSKTLKLKAVYLGSRCTSTREEVRKALGKLARKVDIHKVRPAFETFRIILNRSWEVPS